MMNELNHSALGKAVTYASNYDPSLLFALPRLTKRQELGIEGNWPLYGEDLWTAYEVSWLLPGGKPQVAIADFIIPAQSSYLIESKSIKLYLNSLNQTVFQDVLSLQKTIADDLSKIAQVPVQLYLFSLQEYLQIRPLQCFSGQSLDVESITMEHYQADPQGLQTSTEIVTESLYSDLLKSNCLITQQPDWGSVQINYQGPKINRVSLLQYLVGFRQHNEFHEQCVERIFMDLWRYCKPLELTVYARYTRRGGLDSNPIRSSKSAIAPLLRLVRQ
jgi:7-cyano-7-deazaguanine reductase